MQQVIRPFIAALTALAGCAPACAPPTPPPTPPVEVWAWCGPHPDDPAAARGLTALASAGATAVFGPCLPPDWSTYSPAHPGDRYATPDVYLNLVRLADRAGLDVIVYDARIWSDDPATRAAAIEMWGPWTHAVRAFDMGDEYDPASPDWLLLRDRWTIVAEHITPALGVGPYTNNLGGEAIADAALALFPEQVVHYSFDAYGEGPNGEPTATLAMVAYLTGRVHHVMCAVNQLDPQFGPTPAKLTAQVRAVLAGGCGSVLLFGGFPPYDTPGLAPSSIVDTRGRATPFAAALRAALP